MRSTGGCFKRGVLCAVVAGTLGLLAAGSAGATITKTSITSPASPFIYQYNADLPSPDVTITGTTDSTSPGADAVDIRCDYPGQGSLNNQTIATGVALNSDGTFSWSGPLDEQGLACQLRAVPSGYGDTTLSPFAGVLSELDHVQTAFPGAGTAAPPQPQFDYLYTSTGTAGSGMYHSAGDCGVTSQPIQPSDETLLLQTWSCGAALSGSDNVANRTEILIDGKNAYDSYAAANAYLDSSSGLSSGQAAGFPVLSSSYSRSSTTSGDASMTESEELVSCADATYPATQTKCGGVDAVNIGSWQSDGVKLSRTIQQTDAGQLATVSDTFSSSDGKAHGLDLEYDNTISDNYGQVWKLPGSASYQLYSNGDSASLSGNSEDAIYTQGGTPDPNASAGALIYTTQPNSAVFSNTNELLLDYQRTVPAGGSVTITHMLVSGYAPAITSAITNGFLDRIYKPTVAITRPHKGTVTQQSSVQVSGTARAQDELTLKVDGQTVAVNPDGTWSTDLSLERGRNTIVAVVSDGSGNTAQASETVSYEPLSASTFCVVPSVSRDSLRKAEKALRTANCSVGRIRRVRSRTFRKGTVEHASFSAGVVLVGRTRVGLTESIGKSESGPAGKHRTVKRGRGKANRGRVAPPSVRSGAVAALSQPENRR